ncbi:MAG TPA: cytochrome c [Kofleriaceae bacterium]
MVPYYPVNDFGPLMKGLVIGGVGILHVFLAQFAIGGGILMWFFERASQDPKVPAQERADTRAFVDGFFRALVLVSFVVGALTGVAMWFTTIQVGARTIGLMIDEFHWLWATEWVWFAVEITAGYAFYRYGSRLAPATRRRLLMLYAIAAWLSLYWINGILSWQLTPGAWLDTHSVWAGFYNPTFAPSLLFRTAVSSTLGALAACIVINTMPLPRDRLTPLVRRAARFATPMAAMPVLALWFFAAIPADSRDWLLGGSMPMLMFAGIAAGASFLVGGYAVVGLVLRKLYLNGATATLLLALAFGATAAGEFVREGARKPFTVRGVLYSTSIGIDEVARLRRDGATKGDPYPLRPGDWGNAITTRGALVERDLCDACHTIRGANGIVELVRTWSHDQLRMNIAMLQWTKGYMPPFAGTADDVEALVRYLEWERANRPAPDATPPSAEALAETERWLVQAGTEPAGGR